ncbi:MAG: hypothetical protein QOD99_2242 [Chthoniobacter sp.]|nr:hypothetical protein [Chthoniobacter sp.]
MIGLPVWAIFIFAIGPATMRLMRAISTLNGEMVVASQKTGRNLRDIHHGYVIIGKSAQTAKNMHSGDRAPNY